LKIFDYHDNKPALPKTAHFISLFLIIDGFDILFFCKPVLAAAGV
jgi:hypothetical protein